MRKRNHREFGIATLYQDMSYFLELPVGGGMHSIIHGDHFIDLLVHDLGEPSTVVTLHDPLEKSTTYPQFVGSRAVRDASVNLVALSDPSAAYSNGTFLKDDICGNILELLTIVTAHVVRGMGSDHVLLYGKNTEYDTLDQFARLLPFGVTIVQEEDLALALQA